VKALFVDTAGWVACADGADPRHHEAAAARDGWLEGGGYLLTTDYVADETLTLLRFRLGLKIAEAWWRQVEGSSRLRWEFITLARADKARALFFRYHDNEFSFTDCTSFAVMRELRIRDALTTDDHFAQAGFTPRPATASRLV
jgi:uncharacterized protein